jgi:4-amino-4-deoxy-L-arabinose transferase-like glycosyltransferase
VAIALGVLTKGPIGAALPLLVVAPYAFWRRRFRAVWPPLGIALFLLIVVPWVLAVERRAPGFLRYALVTETWARLTSDELRRAEPLWYFVPFVLGGTFPWVLAATVGAIEGAWRRRRASRTMEQLGGKLAAATAGARPALVFAVLWVAVPLLFLSLSQSKRPHYLLPVVPAFALLAAWAWSRERTWPRAVRASSAVLAALGGALVAAGVVDREWAADPPSVAIAKGVAVTLGGVTIFAGVLAWLGARRRVLSVVALSVPLVAAPSITAPLMAEVARVRSGKELAGVLGPHLERGATILGVETYSPSLAFYLDRPLEVASADGGALRANHVVAFYEDYVERPGTHLRRAERWREVLRTCPEPTIFLLETRDRDERAALEAAGLPVLFDGLLLDALGPCKRAGAQGQEQVGSMAQPGGAE